MVRIKKVGTSFMYDVEEAPGGEQYNTAGQVDFIYCYPLVVYHSFFS